MRKGCHNVSLRSILNNARYAIPRFMIQFYLEVLHAVFRLRTLNVAG